jgi:hypothetical protein
MGLRLTGETRKGSARIGLNPSMRRYQRLAYARKMGRAPPANITYESVEDCIARAGL